MIYYISMSLLGSPVYNLFLLHSTSNIHITSWQNTLIIFSNEYHISWYIKVEPKTDLHLNPSFKTSWYICMQKRTIKLFKHFNLPTPQTRRKAEYNINANKSVFGPAHPVAMETSRFSSLTATDGNVGNSYHMQMRWDTMHWYSRELAPTVKRGPRKYSRRFYLD